MAAFPAYPNSMEYEFRYNKDTVKDHCHIPKIKIKNRGDAV